MAIRVEPPDVLVRSPRFDAGPDREAARTTEPVSLRDVLAWPQAHPVTIRLPRSLALRRAVAALLAAWMVIAGIILLMRPTGEGTGPVEAKPAVAVDPDVARVATARLPLIDVYRSPTDAVALLTLEHPTPSGSPLVFRVETEWEVWYQVGVPSPPFGTTGWVRAGDVDVRDLRLRITIDLDKHLLTAYEEGQIVLRAPVAVGMRDRPRPGRTFVTDRVARSGTRALPLAGYANGEEAIFRGRGLVGIHAVDDALDVGQTVTEGSVGLASDDMKKLFDLVPIGAPVDVTVSEAAAR